MTEQWQKHVEKDSIKLVNVQQEEINGMCPAKVIVLYKDLKATLQYKGKIMKDLQKSHINDLQMIIKESDCIYQCSGGGGQV